MRTRTRYLRAIASIAVMISSLAPPRAEATPACEPPNVLVLLDVSGSMGPAIPGTKYSQAAEALSQVVSEWDQALRFGVMLFPAADGLGCALAQTPDIAPGLGSGPSVADLLLPGSPGFWGGPTGQHDTPMVQALTWALSYPPLFEATRRSYVLLLTDGKQDCCKTGDYDGDPDCLPGSATLDPNEALENRADLVDRVTALRLAGVDTFVVGFGGGTDPVPLGQMAVAGQTATSAGCDPDSESPMPNQACFYHAENALSLSQALGSIAIEASAETCDGLDNDCDGATDEDPADCAAQEYCAYGDCVPFPEDSPAVDDEPAPPTGREAPQPSRTPVPSSPARGASGAPEQTDPEVRKPAVNEHLNVEGADGEGAPPAASCGCRYGTRGTADQAATAAVTLLALALLWLRRRGAPNHGLRASRSPRAPTPKPRETRRNHVES